MLISGFRTYILVRMIRKHEYRTVSVKNLDQKYTRIVLVVCFSLLHINYLPYNSIVIQINDVTADGFPLTADRNLLWHHSFDLGHK